MLSASGHPGTLNCRASVLLLVPRPAHLLGTFFPMEDLAYVPAMVQEAEEL